MGSRGNAGAGDNILKEFNFYPIAVLAAVARVRLFNKTVTGKFQDSTGTGTGSRNPIWGKLGWFKVTLGENLPRNCWRKGD